MKAFKSSWISRYGDEYLTIATTLLTTPPNTEGLMELIRYCLEVEEKVLDAMEEKLRDVMQYITFLADYTTFSPLEVKANCNTFQW